MIQPANFIWNPERYQIIAKLKKVYHTGVRTTAIGMVACLCISIVDFVMDLSIPTLHPAFFVLVRFISIRSQLGLCNW